MCCLPNDRRKQNKTKEIMLHNSKQQSHSRLKGTLVYETKNSQQSEHVVFSVYRSILTQQRTLEAFSLLYIAGNQLSIAVLLSGFCHDFGSFSYVKSDFTELKSFSLGKFKELLFADVKVFAACK